MNEAQRAWVERHAAGARDRVLTLRAELERRRGEPVRSGDLVVFHGLEDAGVQWALLEIGDEGRALVVPADTSPLVGSADVAVAAEAPCGELTLRCALGQWLSPKLVSTAQRTGFLDTDSLEWARRRSAGRDGVDDRGGETDGDPEYHGLLRELETACRALLALESSRRQGPRRIPRRPSRLRRGPALALGLAAALAAVSLAGNLWQWQTISKLRDETGTPAPVADPPMVWPKSEDDRGLSEPLVLDEGVSWVTVVLYVSNTAYETYRLEILEETDGAKLWDKELERRDPGREILVLLPRSFLSPGTYRFVLHGLLGGEETLVERYVLRIRPRDRG